MKDLFEGIVAWDVDDYGVYRAVFRNDLSRFVELCGTCGSVFPAHRCHMEEEK